MPTKLSLQLAHLVYALQQRATKPKAPPIRRTGVEHISDSGRSQPVIKVTCGLWGNYAAVRIFFSFLSAMPRFSRER